jgi:ComF family protein
VRDLLDVAFPRVCVVCEYQMPRRADGVVCLTCWSALRPFPRPICERCGHPLKGTTCRWCERLDVSLAWGRSYCWMSKGAAEAMVYALKYGGWSRIASDMARRLARTDFRSALDGPTLLVPVPLAPRRLRERGYNQSEVLARSLASEWGMQARSLVIRTKETPSQTRLTAEQRLHNVADAFAVDPAARARCAGARCVLIDDVVTTGATLNACATALAAAGALSTGFITFGRALDPRAPPTR